MPTTPTLDAFHKIVTVWSDRKKQNVLVRVDYHRLRVGEFTLIAIHRICDSAGHDTFRPAPDDGPSVRWIDPACNQPAHPLP